SAGEGRRASIYYVTSALPLLNVAVEGQNQIWVAMFFAIAFWLMVKGRTIAASIVLSLPFVVVKLLALLGAPAFLASGERRIVRILSFAVVPLLVFGALIAGGVDVLLPLRLESADQSSGNVPFVVGALIGSRFSLSAGAVDAVALGLL